MPKNTVTFNLHAGRKIGRHYVVEALLGNGSEGEVYQIREVDTGIHRAAKFYYPHKDPKRHLPVKHAQKLNTLRRCPIVLQYHHSEAVTIRKKQYVALISDLYDGVPLDLWVSKHRGKRLSPYVALHVLYNLVKGLEEVHALKQYHGDVHSQNILIKPIGVGFELKLIDFYEWGRPNSEKLKQDIGDSVRIFYECIGGKKYYAKLPPDLKHICAAMRWDTILKRFPTMSSLRSHLESFEWSTML